MKKLMLFAVFFIVLSIGKIYAQCNTQVWAEEFSSTSLDVNKWTIQTGDGCAEGICGWGNNEAQYYQAANLVVSNNTLKITAKSERVGSKAYTSGRIKTQFKGDWTYGHIEARIKIPAGGGLWPAFWLLPTDNTYGAWPYSGEIDIMEAVGAEANKQFGTIHYADANGNHQYISKATTTNMGTYADDFHVYSVYWANGIIKWYIDGYLYHEAKQTDIAPASWPFNQRFYIILNLAVGGNLGGTVDNSKLPATMEVDYVRVYSGAQPSITGKNVVSNRETGVTYTVQNLPSNSNVTWSVPAGASIVSGQGTGSVTVNFGDAGSGYVSANVSSSCFTDVLKVEVETEKSYSKDFSFENFDAAGNVTVNTATTGTLTEVANINASGVNTSALVGKYIRNSAQQYDLLVYNTSSIANANEYVNKTRKFYMDLYTSAPIGTQIILQLENGATATSTNYPTGRHSRYIGYVTANNQWQRIIFTLLDQPDASTSSTQINKVIALFASNTFTGDTYYFDNFDSYKASTTTTDTQAPTTPTSLAMTANSTTTITLSWLASTDNVGVTGYKTYKNGVYVATTTALNYKFTGLTTKTSYVLGVQAIDAAGNASAIATTTKTTKFAFIPDGDDAADDAENRFSIYPNPASSLLNISNTSELSTIGIYNLKGQLLNFINVTTNDVNISIEGYASGSYVVKTIGKDGTQNSYLLVINN